MVIQVKDLSKTIKGATVLKDINIEFESGKVYGLRGKNGCGKTMLMRVLCGLILPTTGTVEINGELLGKDISFPRSVGALIENPSFIANYTGLKNLQILASIQEKITEQQIEDAITQVGLDPFDKRKYKKYSLGMKQRLGIAAAIMELPDIVILDEPINALDEKGVELVRQILQKIRKRDTIVIIACHDKEELELLSDEIFTMEDGKITGKIMVDHNKEAEHEKAEE